jgi:diketogulonate reductase-like aldo/keto reductase
MEFHPYVLAQVEPLLALQTKYGIGTEAFGPLTPILRHPTGGPLQPVLIQIARRLSAATGRPVDKAAVLLLWTYGKGAVAVSTTGNPENICKLGALEDLPDLTPDEVAEIDRVGKSVHFRFYVSRRREIGM